MKRRFTKYPRGYVRATTFDEVRSRKDAIFEEQCKELQQLGITPGNGYGYTKLDAWEQLPQDRKDYYNAQEQELYCIDMLHSILTYDRPKTLDKLMQNRYLQSYIDELGYDKVAELAAIELDEFSHADIRYGTYTDAEDVSYNSVDFRTH